MTEQRFSHKLVNNPWTIFSYLLSKFYLPTLPQVLSSDSIHKVWQSLRTAEYRGAWFCLQVPWQQCKSNRNNLHLYTFFHLIASECFTNTDWLCYTLLLRDGYKIENDWNWEIGKEKRKNCHYKKRGELFLHKTGTRWFCPHIHHLEIQFSCPKFLTKQEFNSGRVLAWM